MIYYKYQDKYLCALEDSYPYEKVANLDKAEELYFLKPSGRQVAKKSHALGHPSDFFEESESLEILKLKEGTADLGPVPQEVASLMEARRIKAVNTSAPNFEECFFMEKTGKKQVNILALGDVGSTLLIGLKLLGRDCIHTIGIYDRSPDKAQRWEYEMNQTSEPFDFEALPEVKILEKEALFDCDVFAFCASKGVPPIGAEKVDVRMVQYEENAKLIQEYAALAAEKGFKGIFAVISDPVDQLCAAVLRESKGALAPEQIKGYGLGVMNARAGYYAKKHPKFAQYLTEGRAFGPHGKDLVIADSIRSYNEDLSLELTKLAVEANLEVRKTGFKPYVAPALSSAAISLVATLEGKWHYSANYLDGAYLGIKNRNLPSGLEIEKIHMDERLFHRIEKTHKILRDQAQLLEKER